MFAEVDRFFSLKSPVQRHVKIASDCAWIVGDFSGWGKNALLLRWASHVDVEPISTCIGDFRVNAVLSVRVYFFFKLSVLSHIQEVSFLHDCSVADQLQRRIFFGEWDLEIKSVLLHHRYWKFKPYTGRVTFCLTKKAASAQYPTTSYVRITFPARTPPKNGRLRRAQHCLEGKIYELFIGFVDSWLWDITKVQVILVPVPIG